jgi:hypothetical protein
MITLFITECSIDIVQVSSKSKENQPINQYISKEEIEAIAVKYANAIDKYMEMRYKELAKQHAKIYLKVQKLEKQIDAILIPNKVSLESILKLSPQPKKVSICGFEFLRTSVIIFVSVLICFFSLVLNIKQMNDFHALKTQFYQLTEYIRHLENDEK